MVRYKRFGYLVLNVTDLDASQAFYQEVVGLAPSDGAAAGPCRFLRCNDQHHDLVLVQADNPGLKRLGFEVESEAELAKLTAVLDSNGLAWTTIPESEVSGMRTSPGIRTSEPTTGCTLDFYAWMEEAPTPYIPRHAKILRLGHTVLKSSDYKASVRYFTEVLNFKVSDSIKERVTFMRCFPNPFHHSLGIGNGNGANGFHHVNFMCTDVDDIGMNYWRLQKLNVPIVNGPGRHLPSGSMFLYFLDPDDMTVEYSFGMEEFPEEAARDPRAFEAVPESFDLWSAPVDKRKSAVGDIERLASLRQ
jgi:2,3-dihydroxy-p-cumate/2,3-dihydroxybenzoate 3,4-dioxygenase